MQKILVTGSNGFIGGYILNALSNMGYMAFGCGRGENKNINFPYLKADLSSGAINININFDFIIHAAARSPKAPFNKYFADNVIGTQNIIEFATRNNVKKIIYLSAVSAFGDIKEVLTESSPRNNPGDYGLTKYIAEKLIYSSGLNYDVYILPGVIGKGCRDPYIMRLAEDLYNGRDVNCYNSDGIFNNVLLVDDLLNFIVKRIESSDKSDVFLLGCAERMIMSKVVNILAEKLNSKSKIEFSRDIKGGFYLDIKRALKAGFCSSSIEKIINNVCDEVQRRS